MKKSVIFHGTTELVFLTKRIVILIIYPTMCIFFTKRKKEGKIKFCV